MAEWKRWAESQFPGEQINNAWELHLRAAQLLVDHYFDVSIHLKPKSSGFLSSELAELFDDLDFWAVGAAKAFMAERFAAAVMVDDVHRGSTDTLVTLLEEEDLAADDPARESRFLDETSTNRSPSALHDPPQG